MRKFVASATVVAVTMMSGCATIFNDKAQTVNVKASNGQTVKGVVDGAPFQTPGAVSVLRTKTAKVFNVETEGCAKQTTLESKVDVKFFGNILLGGVFGSTTDYSTDKMWKYDDSVTISCNN